AALAVAAVLAVVAAGLGAAAWQRHDGGTPTPGSSPSAASPSVGAPDRDQQQLDALTAVLDARRRAVLDHDRDAWLATVDPQSTTFRDEQGAVFDNLRAVPFRDWTYQYLGRAPDLSSQRVAQLGGEVWVARVLAGYRLRGYDTTSSDVEQYLTVVRRGSAWFIASTEDGGTAPQPWDLGRVRVARGDRVLVIGTASPSTLGLYAEAGDRAVARVSEVWGRAWSRHAVLVAPRTQAEFGQLLLRSKDGLSQVAAVTTGDLGGESTDATTGRAGNDRVVINPGAFARLGATGRRVVLTHEMTHVAVRQSTATSVPIWLSEGFADFVGYRGTGVTRRVGAGDLLAQVRAGHAPRTLPTTADFDPTRTTIAPSYSASWLACSLIADTYGTSKLVALYRRAASTRPGTAPDPDAQLRSAFPAVLGRSEQGFTADWRRYLDQLARA
ncbi:hypothetical protein, partial [Angustibacter peucedani]